MRQFNHTAVLNIEFGNRQVMCQGIATYGWNGSQKSDTDDQKEYQADKDGDGELFRCARYLMHNVILSRYSTIRANICAGIWLSYTFPSMTKLGVPEISNFSPAAISRFSLRKLDFA